MEIVQEFEAVVIDPEWACMLLLAVLLMWEQEDRQCNLCHNDFSRLLTLFLR